MVITEAVTEIARRRLSWAFEHGGSIQFNSKAVELGAVNDITPDRWYDLVQDEHGDYYFIDNVGDRNYAGAPGSKVWLDCPSFANITPF